MLLATLIVIIPNTYESSAKVVITTRNDPAGVPSLSPCRFGQEGQGVFNGAGNQSSVEVLREHPNVTRVPMRFDVKKHLEGKVSSGSDIPLQTGDLVVAQGNTRRRSEPSANSPVREVSLPSSPGAGN
jgi:multidrug efflux pump subunit AcrA (membrane-fusion protein)